MADQNKYENALAEKIHEAERAVAAANAAPAGPQRIERILKADRHLIELQQEHDHCVSGQAGKMIPVTR